MCLPDYSEPQVLAIVPVAHTEVSEFIDGASQRFTIYNSQSAFIFLRKLQITA